MGTTAEAPDGGGLQHSLQKRHLTMIAIGGVIGAGLFVGSGATIKAAGPAAFLTYAITGVLIVLVMRMLGEMAVANPSTGSFADYSRRALGDWAGFSVGWLYWYFWVIVVGFEAVAGGKIVQDWWPHTPLWLIALVLMVAMTGTNLFSVRSYGEFEYWFASVKVLAIIAFLVLGTLFVVGWWPDKQMDFSNLTKGGFAPNGTGAIFSAIVVVVFSMVGPEIATIAAAESKDPARAISRATNSVIYRIGLFFVGSIFLIAVIVPWDSPTLGTSPFVTAFKTMGIPHADNIMRIVVLTAVLSCLNSAMYTASRMLFVLAGRGEAPRSWLRVNSRGVPMHAILASSFIGFVCVILAYVAEDTVFLFLLNSSGAVILFVYFMIAISQLVLRPRTPPEKLIVKMWGYPVLTILTAGAIVAILVAMGFQDGTRSQLWASLLSWAVILIAFVVLRLTRRRDPLPEEPVTR
ncbi:amino acid permease [Mycobacteroides salmoniphilum]|uniref:amino acid permease n=1 Tax=Mycobacteroides salmoniphilum TaxID=404941 RepID=UPI000991AAA7|nr:amino acid permease [Mycobacteroides salmoniphilum]QCH26353.1 GABA permease [Mycobacteroides salmoniphilum]